ncbi:TPA: fimbrial protein [Escherichia coli]|nr:PapB/FocB family fimbrial expression transcriptional regulator [Escherichia coli]ELX8197008.1 fimbrial protein [Salmonella enterica]HAE3764015.1 fimbrial protein [Salmonella enterica subsp. enterica serovar Enteritidis]HDN5015703.1 fimbrial protein [Salmonella enterica subsp. enterica serovar Typhimurium]HDN5989081.1 fimbrial protein [Salmonella enterica subsp. enterica serovar Birkenhead]EEW1830757.1 fimbrial protein [Escherichia coli]
MEYIKEHDQQPQQSSFLEKKNHILPSGSMSDDEFWCMIELTPIRSDKIIRALHDYFVLNRPRAHCCDKHGVSNGYFGACISRFEHVIQVVNTLLNYYKMSGSKKNE